MPEASEITTAINEYLLLAEVYNKLVKQKQPVPLPLVRDIAVRAAQVFRAYTLPKNWFGERPTVTIPLQMADDVARQIELICKGHIPKWMIDLQRKGAPPCDPKMRRDIGIAVAYKKLCESGVVRDRRATSTVADAYGVSNRQVQNWMQEYSDTEPGDFFPDASSDEDRAQRIANALHEASARYKEWGRGPNNTKPLGKAKRRRGVRRSKSIGQTAKR